MIKKNNLKILAIDPGTKEMGIAYFDKGRLIYYGVKGIKNRQVHHEALNKGRKIILSLINYFNPDILAVESTYFANKSKGSILLNAFTKEIIRVGRRKGLKVVCYAPSTVKKFICGNGRASKEDVAKMIVRKYPKLKAYTNQNRKWKDKYHQNMFDAVALGVMAISVD